MNDIEHGIILLKPDGVKINLEKKLYYQLGHNNLEVVAQKKYCSIQ